jgi:hypothetical protein
MEHMHSADAISAFIEKGGRVVRLQGTIPVTVAEVLDYLWSRGVRADYSPGHARLYVCKGKLITLSKLLEVANRHRRAEQLPPFVARVRV